MASYVTFHVRRNFTADEWRSIVAAARGVFEVCARRGIRITGPTGVASPQLTPSWIAFSAAPARSAVSDGPFRLERRTDGDWTAFDGGSGDEAPAVRRRAAARGRTHGLAARAVLLAAKTVAPDAIELRSDEDLHGERWVAAQAIVTALGIERAGPAVRFTVSPEVLAKAESLASLVVALSDVDYRVPAARSGWHVVSIIGAQHDLEAYECSCAWCQPQGDEGSIGRCCSHCLAVAIAVGEREAAEAVVTRAAAWRDERKAA